ncbi:MAG: alpha/beta hydrolase [Chloroflexi bacterium]|nr:alpha/beta hydrolase [Chloroflexota bacterium]
MLRARRAVVKPLALNAYGGIRMTTDQFTEIDGFELRYRLYGSDDAPLAVIGHGIFASLDQYADRPEALDVLAGRYRILLYDARGHGESEGPENPDGYSWQQLGEEMLALAAFAGEERPILGGASMSANAALWCALERPEAVRALVLIAPPPLGPRELREESETQALQMLATLATAVESFGLSGTADMAANMPAFTASAGEGGTEILRSQNPRTIVPIIRGLHEHTPRAATEYAAIKAPVAVFAHPDDALHPLRSANLLAEHIPDCRLHVGPERDYWQNHPDELAREIIAFLDDVL